MHFTKHRLRYYCNIIQRFYNQSTQQLLGNQPYELLFTQFLNSSSSQLSPTSPSTNLPKKSNQQFKVGRSQYLSFADQNPLGSIIQMTHKQTNLTLLSTSFSSSDIAGMYKSIQKIKPDLVIAQIRPDLILSEFNLLPKKNQIFSDRLYFKQLLRSPFQIMPSSDMRDHITKKLKGRVTMKSISPQYIPSYAQQLQQSKSFSNFISKQFINNYVIGTSAYYCERNQMKMVLCGLPEISQRQIIANQFSLMELQVMFKRSCEQLALYSKVNPRKTANFLFPEVFVRYSDQYMMTLLEYVIAKGGYKNILVLTGVMENQAVKEYLENKTIGTILQRILPPKPEGSILRDLDNFEVIEKHCILDVMEYGSKILEIPIEELETTNKMGQFYGDPHYVDKNMAENVMRFRLNTYTKYLGVMEECKRVGETLKTKDWIRRAIET